MKGQGSYKTGEDGCHIPKQGRIFSPGLGGKNHQSYYSLGKNLISCFVTLHCRDLRWEVRALLSTPVPHSQSPRFLQLMVLLTLCSLNYFTNTC